GSAEAGAEHRLRLGDPRLGAGHLGGVTAEEPIHRLAGGELADGRQHPVGVAGEEEDVLRMPAHAGLRMTGDVLQWVADAGVLRLAAVAEIHLALAVLLEAHVLQQGSEAYSIPDLGFLLLGKVDALGIAASLEIEHAVLPPAVLIVADQPALGVGAQGGLPRAAQPEEDGRVAIRADV